jgi:hypothetical protein
MVGDVADAMSILGFILFCAVGFFVVACLVEHWERR